MNRKNQHVTRETTSSSLLPRAPRRMIAISLAVAGLAIGARASAGSTPTGFGCPVGYTLVIEANTLTCKKALTSGTIQNTTKPSCSDLRVQSGNDQCRDGYSEVNAKCLAANYFLQVDHSGMDDACITYGYDYLAPKKS